MLVLLIIDACGLGGPARDWPIRKKDAGGNMPPAWLEICGGGLLARGVGATRVGVRGPLVIGSVLLVPERVDDALDPERTREASRRMAVGVRGDSGVGLEVNREPEFIRILGGADEDGKEGGAWSDIPDMV